MIILMEFIKTLFLAPATTDEIGIIIEKFKNCSSGWDGIKPNIIKQTYSGMIGPLCYIINLSFNKGYVPDELNMANIVPIFKKGDATLIKTYRPNTLIKNYRPISILPVLKAIDLFLYYQYFQRFLKD